MVPSTEPHTSPILEHTALDGKIKAISNPRGDCSRTSIHQLPAEILLLIFEIIKSDLAVHFHKLSAPRQTKVPKWPVEVIISHICTFWRSLVLAAPSLWITININVLSGPHRHLPFDRVHAYLTRSGALPIDIRIVDDLDPSASITPFRKLLSMLISHLSRWSTFYFISENPSFRRELMHTLSSASLPPAIELKTLRIFRAPGTLKDTRWLRESRLRFKITAPKLISLEMGESLPACYRSTVLSARSLTHLRISCHVMSTADDLEELIDILAALRSLEALWLSNEASDMSPEIYNTFPKLLNLPSLNRLSLDGVTPSMATFLFQRLDFSNVSRFDLANYRWDLSWLTVMMSNTVRTLQKTPHGTQNLLPKLETLSLTGLARAAEDDVKQFYTHIPSIHRLRLSFKGGSFEPNVLHQLLPLTIGGPGTMEDAHGSPLQVEAMSKSNENRSIHKMENPKNTHHYECIFKFIFT
ncbi:hypothetical protein BJ138DRAFT_1111533 [Hygrophoropsis aurantiaca]|uniref:Uncharacterized protein n=1 Tax=Hygrophoropsis aurantiaca TaxID=72124 RepID=A0ACB8AJC3_9AGAM|nr:hypothetical protein BJ138DRAFT_1111533 [Hygrophoropsis aurantiaca]